MKRIGSILLALALLCTVCACNKPAEDQTPESGGPSWQEQYDLGLRYLSEGKYEEAILAFTAAIEIDPKQAPAYVGRGDAYVQLGDTEENLTAARLDYEQAIELDELLAEAYLGLADVYIRQGDYEKALEVLRQGLEAVGESEALSGKIAEMEGGNISDKSGKTWRTSSYDPDGKLQWRHDFTYNEQGKRSSITAYDGQGNQTGHIDMIYDEMGNRLQDYRFSPDTGEISINKDTYDSEGNRISRIYCDAEGNAEWSSEFSYENGLCVRQIDFTAEGKLKGTWVNEYSGKKRTKRSYYEADNTLSYYQTWEYNEEGKVTTYSSYNANGALQWYNVYRYDADGQQLGEDRYDGQGNLESSTVNE